MIPVDIKTDHEYHIVELHNIMLPHDTWQWLVDTFGDGKDGRWFLKHPNLYFANKSDHLLFTLRWS